MTTVSIASTRISVPAGEYFRSPSAAKGNSELDDVPLPKTRESLIAKSGLSNFTLEMPIVADNAPKNLWGEIRLPDGQSIRIYKSGLLAMPNSVGAKLDKDALVEMPGDPKFRSDRLLELLGGELRVIDADASVKSAFSAQLLAHSAFSGA